MAGRSTTWQPDPTVKPLALRMVDMFVSGLLDAPATSDDPHAPAYPWNHDYWNQPGNRYPYRNARTGKLYEPHNAQEEWFVYGTTGRKKYNALLGGEGSGKTSGVIIRDLELLRKGNKGIMVSSDLPQFKISLWPAFAEWCPKEAVIGSQTKKLDPSWQPDHNFILTFVTGGQLICGGIDDPLRFDGPNVHFAHLDEARRKETADALKTLDGRVRIVGKDGSQPELYISSTQRKTPKARIAGVGRYHWLFEYFGPISENEQERAQDERLDFKQKSFVLQLSTLENVRRGNLSATYVEDRVATLSDVEKRILIDNEWADETDDNPLLSNINLWDMCLDSTLPPLDQWTPIVIALDGAVSGDSFALAAVSRHPKRHSDVAVRLTRKWSVQSANASYLETDAQGRVTLNFDVIEREIIDLLAHYNVMQLTFDEYQLHYMAQRLRQKHRVWTQKFEQTKLRQIADTQLVEIIQHRKLVHNGDLDLREHISNANREVLSLPGDPIKLRIVKRTNSLKIDLAVCVSMAVYRCLELPMIAKTPQPDVAVPVVFQVPKVGAPR